MKAKIFYFIAAFLFGAGLELSQMTNPQKVQGFLNLTRQWDPSLIFVMIGAILVNSIVYYVWIKKKETPLFSPKFLIPTSKDITPKLIIGSILFGIGWGIAGFCPGPALSSLFRGQSEVFIVVASMLSGMLIYNIIFERILEKS
jgi:uncharacterized membrane protein YedE/YeeE